MIDPLVSLATRVEADPFFLSWALALYATSENLDDDALAAELGCAVEQLPLVRLCRTPRADIRGFREDVAVIAEHYHLDRQMLARAVKRARVIQIMRGAAPVGGGLLMAARDREAAPRQEPEAP